MGDWKALLPCGINRRFANQIGLCGKAFSKPQKKRWPDASLPHDSKGLSDEIHSHLQRFPKGAREPCGSPLFSASAGNNRKVFLTPLSLKTFSSHPRLWILI